MKDPQTKFEKTANIFGVKFQWPTINEAGNYEDAVLISTDEGRSKVPWEALRTLATGPSPLNVKPLTPGLTGIRLTLSDAQAAMLRSLINAAIGGEGLERNDLNHVDGMLAAQGVPSNDYDVFFISHVELSKAETTEPKT